MTATASPVSVSRHARTRWLQRVAPEDPYPGASVREAFEEASASGGRDCIRRHHPGLGVLFVAVQRGTTTVVVTVYETASKQRGDDT